MSIQGSTLSHPIRPDNRGTLAAINDRKTIIEESIRAIVETRMGERVMLPDYGIPDFVFDVMDAGFTARMAYFVEQQIAKYEPLVDKVRASVGYLDGDDRFIKGFVENQQIAAFAIEYVERGSNTPQNLVFPTWRLREE
ncbi:MAG: GPW/gp25 family protein [Blastocatellia bacterium]